MPFKVGDVVQLKSGGPKMTVSKIIPDDGTVTACWLDGTHVCEMSFHPDMLDNYVMALPQVIKGRR